MITHLSLDLDGTLVDWRPIQASALFVSRMVQTLSKEIGIKNATRAFWSMNQILTTKNVPETLSKLTNAQRATYVFSESAGINETEASALIERALLKVFPTLEKCFFPVQGASDFVNWAKDRYAMILATNPVWPKEIIQMRIKWAKLDPSIFQFITDSASMHFFKPENRYFSEILKLQSLDATQVLHVGNEIQMDLPASQAGIKVFILDRNKALKKITPAYPTQAPAWRGNFQSLKTLLLEKNL